MNSAKEKKINELLNQLDNAGFGGLARFLGTPQETEPDLNKLREIVEILMTMKGHRDALQNLNQGFGFAENDSEFEIPPFLKRNIP